MSNYTFNNHLFKFAPYNTNTFKIILNKELWFGEPENQNDPYEGEFIIDGFSEEINEKKRIQLLKEIFPNVHESHFNVDYSPYNLSGNELINKYSDYLKAALKKQFGICSFSTKYDEILLWSHYSMNHEGICFVFKKDKLINSIKEIERGIQHDFVNYEKEVPKIKIFFNSLGSPSIDGFNVFKFKFKNFKYEKEYRLINYFNPKDENSRLIKYNENALEAIILGEKMTLANRRSIVNLVNSNPTLKDIDIYISSRNLKTRLYNIEKIHKQHPQYYELFKDLGAIQKNIFINTRCE